MSSDRVTHAMRTVSVPGMPEARDRATAAARLAYRQRSHDDTVRRPWRRRVTIAIASIALLAAISSTPPGQAAAGWVTKLVGIGHDHPPAGHIGGPPSDPNSVGLRPPHPEIVIGKGTTPDGQPWELVASTSWQAKYDTCFTLWSPRRGQPHHQRTGQCAQAPPQPTIGEFCVANGNGCGAAHQSRRDTAWTSPAIAVVSPDVTRLRVVSERPSDRIRGIRVVGLPKEFRRRIGVPHPLKAALFFVVHDRGSPVRFKVTALDRHGRVIDTRLGGAGPDGLWRGPGG